MHFYWLSIDILIVSLALTELHTDSFWGDMARLTTSTLCHLMCGRVAFGSLTAMLTARVFSAVKKTDINSEMTYSQRQ